MQDFSGDVDSSSKSCNDTLLSHTDAQDRDLATEVLDGLAADARIRVRMARARTNDQLSRFRSYQILDSYLVISYHSNICAFQHEILVDIPGK